MLEIDAKSNAGFHTKEQIWTLLWWNGELKAGCSIITFTLAFRAEFWLYSARLTSSQQTTNYKISSQYWCRIAGNSAGLTHREIPYC